MKSYKLALASLALFAHSAIAAPGSADIFRYDVTALHHTDNRIDHTQQVSLSTKLGQKGTFESLTRAITPVTSRVGDGGVISRDEVEGVAFSITPGYLDEEGGLTSVAHYKVWTAGTLVLDGSHTFRQPVGESFALPEVSGYRFIVKASR